MFRKVSHSLTFCFQNEKDAYHGWEKVSVFPQIYCHENLQWTPINDFGAKVNFQFDGISISYRVYFNDKNETFKMETERYMGYKNLAKWTTYFFDYKQINEVIVPAKLEGGLPIKFYLFSVCKIQYSENNFRLIPFRKFVYSLNQQSYN